MGSTTKYEFIFGSCQRKVIIINDSQKGDTRCSEYNEIGLPYIWFINPWLFLFSVGSSDEPARFLEIHYRGTTEDQAPHALVGKGKLVIDQLQL